VADQRETYAALLSGDQVGQTVTVPTVDGDLAEGVVRILVHTAHAVALFLGDDVMPTMVAPSTIAVVS
jgi:VCBS repeat-containing protein